MVKAYIKFEISKELNDKVLQLVEIAKNIGKIRKGTNEATKALEKGLAQLVIIAEDVEPEEIVMHLPVLCEEKKVPYVYVKSKQDLGRASGIDVPTASIALLDVGEGKNLLKEIVKNVEALVKK